MRTLKFGWGPLAALMMSLQTAVAADVALVIGDLGQIDYMQDGTGSSARDFTSALRRAGFEVVQPKNRSSGHMRLTTQSVEKALLQGQVDRLVIVVMGPIASSKRESWVMSNAATQSTSLNIGVTGLPIGALSDMATHARAQAVIMISPGIDVGTLGAGLAPGLRPFDQADGVVYVIGPAEALAEVMQQSLLDPEVTFAQAARAAPKGVRFEGPVSEHIGLMTPGE